MRSHTMLGAGLFSTEMQDVTGLTHDIALNHHQPWDGNEYPEVEGERLIGTDIPLAACITSIADVFDALVSSRCYKQPWPMEKAYVFLKQESGRHFSPELVECFMDLKDTIPLIYERFPDVHQDEPVRDFDDKAGAKA